MNDIKYSQRITSKCNTYTLQVGEYGGDAPRMGPQESSGRGGKARLVSGAFPGA